MAAALPPALAAQTASDAYFVIVDRIEAAVVAWLGASGRKARRFLPTEVGSVQPYEGGRARLRGNPSVEGGFPDARTVKGWALNGTVRVGTARALAAARPADVATNDLVQWATQQRCP